jgi:hypothetical protein
LQDQQQHLLYLRFQGAQGLHVSKSAINVSL